MGEDDRDAILCRLCRSSFRAIIATHLVKRHGFAVEHPVQDFKKRFGLPVAISSATASLKRASIRRHHERVGSAWDRERVRRHMRRRARKQQPLNLKAVERDDPRLLKAAVRIYGAWDTALLDCGLQPRNIRLARVWTRELVVRAIRARNRAGEALNACAIKDDDRGLLQAAINRFGSWNSALESAGVSVWNAQRRHHWTREDTLREVGALRGRVTWRQAFKHHRALWGAACRFFKSWRHAVEQAR